MATNEELVAQAHDINLEGDESEAVATAVVSFIDTTKAEFAQSLADAQAVIDDLTTKQLPEAQRTEITDALSSAKSKFDNMQRVLTAVVTPAEEPLPEPEA